MTKIGAEQLATELGLTLVAPDARNSTHAQVYEHGYYFISTFINDHLRHYATAIYECR